MRSSVCAQWRLTALGVPALCQAETLRRAAISAGQARFASLTCSLMRMEYSPGGLSAHYATAETRCSCAREPSFPNSHLHGITRPFAVMRAGRSTPPIP